MNARNTHTSRARRLASMNTLRELVRRLDALQQLAPEQHKAAELLRDAITIRRSRAAT